MALLNTYTLTDLRNLLFPIPEVSCKKVFSPAR